MCFDKNINGNRDVKSLECDYLSVQRWVKLTLVETIRILTKCKVENSTVCAGGGVMSAVAT